MKFLMVNGHEVGKQINDRNRKIQEFLWKKPSAPASFFVDHHFLC